MKHLKTFESWESNPLSRRLATQAEDYSRMERPDKSKKIRKNYTGTLCYNPTTKQYYMQIPNIEKKPYIVRGIPPAPDLIVNIVPTESFTEEDLSKYSSLSSLMTYGWEDGSGKWKDYSYLASGYSLDSDLRTQGVYDILHITDLKRA